MNKFKEIERELQHYKRENLELKREIELMIEREEINRKNRKELENV